MESMQRDDTNSVVDHERVQASTDRPPLRIGHLVDVLPTRDGMELVRIKGDRLTLYIVPEAGGKILQLIENASGFKLLWENPRVPLQRTYAGAPFDDVWCGGWDDVFPTDPPCELDGNTHHDHGDLWIAPWSWSVEVDEPERMTIHLSRYSVSLPCRVDKWITLRKDEAQIAVRMRLTNLGTFPVRFMWNQHIAHAIGQASRIHMPVSRMGVSGPAPTLGNMDQVGWPLQEGVDLSCIPGPEAGGLEFLYALDLRDGWCAVTHPSHGVAVRISFDRDVFRTPWLWKVFGGWRGHHVLLTELCTSRPGSLATAVANRSAATLAGGSSLETEVFVTVAASFEPNAPGDQDPLIL